MSPLIRPDRSESGSPAEDAARVLRRLRRLLAALAMGTFAGTIVELLLTEHVEEPLQVLPFGLCAIAMAALALTWIGPSRGRVLAMRIVMTVVGLGGVYGVWTHWSANLAFELEIRPNAVASEVIADALMGASPLMAPGILTLAAVLATAATLGLPERGTDA